MSDEDINEKNDKAENIADPVTEAQEENQPENLSTEEDDSRDPNRPIDVRFALRINISDRDLSKMVSVYRGIAIKTSVISAVLLLITCILPSLSDEDMVFPYSMLFWFVLILTAVRTIVSVRDIMRDKDYYLQKMAIAAIISEDKDKDTDTKDDNSDAEVDDRRPETLKEEFLSGFRVRYVSAKIKSFVLMLLAVYGTTYFGDFLMLRDGLSSLSTSKAILVIACFIILFLVAMRAVYFCCILGKIDYFRMGTKRMVVRARKNSES